MFQNSIFIILFTILMISCKSKGPFLKDDQLVDYDPEKVDKYYECKSKWEYQNLDTPMKLFVIAQGDYMVYSINTYPNIYYGINANNDTIAVLDCIYKGGRNFEGQYIIIEPYSWSSRELGIYSAIATISEYSFLKCVVKKAYRARIGGYIDKKNRIKKINLPEK